MSGPVKGSVMINKNALAAAMRQAAYLFRQAGIAKDEKVIEVLTKEICKVYLRQIKVERLNDYRANPIKRLIADMSPGEEIEIDELPRQTVHAMTRDIRRLKQTPNAKYQIAKSLTPGKTFVRYLLEGERPYKDARANPKAVFLASVELGKPQSTNLWTKATRVGLNDKTMARRILRDINADWKSITLANGKVQVRRIS